MRINVKQPTHPSISLVCAGSVSGALLPSQVTYVLVIPIPLHTPAFSKFETFHALSWKFNQSISSPSFFSSSSSSSSSASSSPISCFKIPCSPFLFFFFVSLFSFSSSSILKSSPIFPLASLLLHPVLSSPAVQVLYYHTNCRCRN